MISERTYQEWLEAETEELENEQFRQADFEQDGKES